MHFFRLAVDFGLESGSTMPAVISFTKSPHTSKTKKKSFFKKVFSKKKTGKKEKASPDSTRKAMSMEISPASLTAEERDQLMKHYTLQLRPNSSSSGAGAATTASDVHFSSLPSNARHSMPLLDDYDSPGSPDEELLASMAKV